MSDFRGAEMEAAASRDRLAAKNARIKQLETENASLASWQCEFTDGKTGLVYGAGGSTYCAMAKRVQKLEAALRLAKDALADLGVDDVLIAIDAALGEERT